MLAAAPAKEYAYPEFSSCPSDFMGRVNVGCRFWCACWDGKTKLAISPERDG